MRFLVTHKVGPRMEAGQVEKREITEMGAFIQESIKQGVFTNGAGLLPSARRTRFKVEGGKETIAHGPYKGSNELLAGVALVKVENRDEAIAWARRFSKVIGDCDMEIGSVTEAWDLGFVKKPEGKIPERYLLLMMANEASESEAPPSEREQADMGVLLNDMISKGVLEFTEGIKPSKLGTRLKFAAGKRTAAFDGPFTESKEMIAGFSIINVPTKQAALEWADRYGSILTDLEVDVLALHDEAAYDGNAKKK